MKVDKLMTEVDHGARNAYEERVAAGEPGPGTGGEETPSPPPSATPPEPGVPDSAGATVGHDGPASTTRRGGGASPPSTTRC